MEQKYKIRTKSRNGVTKPHFWIEGKRLESAGFVAGARYNTVTNLDSAINGGFRLVLDPNGKKKVSGVTTVLTIVIVIIVINDQRKIQKCFQFKQVY